MSSPYHLLENDAYSYEFVTDQGIKYAIYFLDYGYMFSDYPNITENIFTFNIDVISGKPDDLVADERIGITVKEDGIAVIEGTPIYNSLLVHKSNKHWPEIVLAYNELNERAGEK